jgi:hypothetical protein
VAPQLADPGDTTDPTPDLQQKRIQKVTGTLLFYARAVNPTMLMTLSTIAAQQSKATLNTVKATNQLLDYCHTHPNATLKYRASDMILKIHSDASYNAEPKGRSRGGGHYYLGDTPSVTPEQPQGPLLNRSNVIKNVMGSAAEAEVGVLYDNLREGVPLRNTLREMGHPQPPALCKLTTPPPTVLPTNKSNKQKSKAMQMRLYWIQDRIQQKQCNVYWRPGPTNLADYFNKHHAPAYHQHIRATYVHTLNLLSQVLRGCIDTGAGLTQTCISPHPQSGLITE